MKQLTLRHIPEPVAVRLREEAVQRGLSVNRTAIAILEEALGLSSAKSPKSDLSMFAGVWSQSEVEEFEQNTAAHGKIDMEQWKQLPPPPEQR